MDIRLLLPRWQNSAALMRVDASTQDGHLDRQYDLLFLSCPPIHLGLSAAQQHMTSAPFDSDNVCYEGAFYG